MVPRFPAHNRTDRSFSDPKSDRRDSLRVGRCANGKHILFGESGDRVVFSTLVTASTLRGPICGIVTMASKPEVIRVAAFSVRDVAFWIARIAGMADAHPFWDRAVGEHPSDPVRALLLAAEDKDSIPAAIEASIPKPTFVRRSGIEAFGESNFSWSSSVGAFDGAKSLWKLIPASFRNRGSAMLARLDKLRSSHDAPPSALWSGAVGGARIPLAGRASILPFGPLQWSVS